MKDFYGKKIEVGDIIEVRRRGDDERTTFATGKVMLNSDGDLAINRYLYHHSSLQRLGEYFAIVKMGG